jgi:hypothetical protein
MEVFDPLKEQPKKPEVFDPLKVKVDTTAIQASARAISMRVPLYSALTGEPEESVEQKQAADNGAAITSHAQVMAQQNSAIIRENRVLAAIDQQEQDTAKVIEDVIGFAEIAAQTPLGKNLIDPVVTAAVFASDNPLAKKEEFDKLNKVSIASRVAEEFLNKDYGGTFVGEFSTSLASSIVPVVNLFTIQRQKDLNTRAKDLFNTPMPPEQFEQEFTNLLSEAGDVLDVFRNENRMLAENWIASFVTYNEDGSAAIDTALAALELIPGIGTISLVKPAATIPFKMGASAIAMSGIDVGRLTHLAFPNRGVELAESIIAKTAIIDDPAKAALMVPLHTSPSLSRTSFAVPTTLSATDSAATKIFELKDEVFNTLKAVDSPMALEETAVRALAADVIAAKRAAGAFRVIDMDVARDGLGNLYYAELHGNRLGKPFATEKAAQSYAKAVGAEDVFKDAAGGWFAVVRENIPYLADGKNTLEKLRYVTSTNPEELGVGFFAKFGSPAAQTTDRLLSLWVQAEGFTAKASALALNDVLALEKTMSRAEIGNVEFLLKELSDGPASVRGRVPTGPTRNTSYSQAEFETEYFSKFQRSPSKRETAYYLALQNKQDIAWFFDADKVFKEEVAKGTVVFRNTGEDFTARRLSTEALNDLSAARPIYDVDTGKVITKDKITPNMELYFPAQGAFVKIGGNSYDIIATTKPIIRRMTHSDVLPRRAGMSRIYDTRHTKYVKQESVELLDGTFPKEVGPNTFMAVRTEQEAAKAVTEINNIVGAIQKIVRTSVNSTPKQLIDELRVHPKKGSLNAVVAANNGWGENFVSSIDDFLDWAEENNFNIKRLVEAVSDKTPVSVEVSASFGGAKTFGDAYKAMSASNRGRRPTPLIGYGGHLNSTASPISTVKQSVLNSLSKNHEAQYITAAVTGLMKTTLEQIVLGKNVSRVANPEDLLTATPTLRGKLAALKNDILNDGDELGRKLLLEAEKIEWRLNQNSFDSVSAAIREGLSNFFYNFSDFSLVRKISPDGKGKITKGLSRGFDRWSTDLSTFARTWAFDTKLGLFAYDQYMVQASGFINIAAIADPKALAQGGGLYPVVRALIENGNENILKETAKKLAPVVGTTEDDFINMVRLLKESGRTMSSLTAAELSQNAAGILSTGAVRSAGRVFYNEGELVNSISAHAIAFFELRSRFPTIDPMSQKGKEWIATRQNTLRNGMTAANRSVGQQLPMFQFLTYNFRIAEAMLAGTFGGTSRSVLTNKEKVKLAVMHLAMYGLSAAPFGGRILERFDKEYGIPVSDEAYNIVRRGVLDYALSNIVGADTALSQRLGFGEGLTNLMYDLVSLSGLEVFGGPAGTIGLDVFKDTKNLLGAIKSGNFELAQADFQTLLQNIKTYDLATKVYLAIETGKLYSKNSTNAIAEIDIYETVAVALGIPLAKVNDMYAAQRMSFEDSKEVKKITKLIQQRFLDANTAYQVGDYDKSTALNKEALSLLHSLPIAVRSKVWNDTRPEVTTNLDQTIWNSIRVGQEPFRNSQ